KKNAYWLFAYVGAVLMIAQGVLYRRLAKRVSEVTFMTAGIILMALGVAGLAGVSYMKSLDVTSLKLTVMMFALAVAVVGFSFLTPSAQALISRRTSAEKQGEVLGVN